ncbi:MAG: RDD family protein [Pseudomonadota bacterium]
MEFRSPEPHPFENDQQISQKVDQSPGLISETSLNNKAGFWIRFLAFSIDNIVLQIIYTLFFITGGLAVYLASDTRDWLAIFDRAVTLAIPYNILMLAITVGYFTYLHGSTGQTIGKMMCQLKVVLKNGEPLSYGKSFLRFVGYFVSAIVLNIGFLWVAFDKDKQGWHDKIASTYVIKLSDEKT